MSAGAHPRAVKAREDLKYHERVVGDEEVIFIHDPVRGTYIKFNPLQAAMLRALDGKRTAADVADVLSEQFDVEIPQEAASRFVERARDMMLLDVASYDVTPDAARAQVRKALRKAGFRMRSTANRDPSRSLSQESMLFAEAFRQLDLGLPLRAAGCLAKIRERNPRNLRAKQLYELIQTAYIKASGKITADLPTHPVFNPHRLLTWVDRGIGRFLFAWPGVLALVVYLYLGAHAYTLISWDKVSVSVVNVVVAICAMLGAGLIHELSHGLTCQHYGGDVTEVGVMMFYGFPAPYCDTSSSYLIPDRRHKMMVQLAGTIGNLVCLATQSILLATLDPDVPIYSGIALSMIVQLAAAGWDFVPFIKTDAYYALCDYYQFTNLKERATKLTLASLSKLLGIEMAVEELPRYTRRLLVLFAILSYLFTVWSIFLLTRWLAPIVERLGVTGLVVVFFIMAYELRDFTLVPFRDLVRLLVRERRRIFTLRRSAAFLVAGIVLVAPWFLRRPVIVDADFVVLPQQRGDVRAQTSGRVDRILVKEGDRVQRGQPIANLSNPTLEVNIVRAEAKLAVATHRLAELQNGARPEELALARTRVDRANGEAARSASEAAVALKLAAANLAPRSGADTAEEKFAATAGSAHVERLSLSLMEAGAREEEIAVAKAEQSRVASQLAQLRSDVALLVLRSPIDGIVATPHLEQKLEAFLRPGDQFAEVDDLRAGVAEIALTPSDDVGEIAAKDAIELRLYTAPRSAIYARVDRLRDSPATSSAEERVVVVTSSFPLDRPLSGVTGHARIYGAERSLAYAYLYLPFQRLFKVRLWSVGW